ncbi:MAG: hypothetical protein ILP11_04370, partial [Alphaproteobacteria bacterium]|nr:hypothetical protein [Alphaproteobacteria bacterium]
GADTDVGPGATECNCPTGSDWNKYVETCEPPSCDTYVDCPASANYVACVEHLCKEYIPVEYIQSDGTQYFDTGVTGNQDTEITVTAARIDSNGYYKYSQLAGWFKTGSNESITINVNNTDYNNGVCRFNGIASSQGAAKVFHANPGHAITYSISRNGMVQGNATVDTFSGVGTFTTSSTLCLLKSCGTSGTERPWRLYGAQFTNTQPTDRDFKPVKDEDGKGCLYDVVTHEPLYHLGGGTMGIGEF